ncbi:MAG: glycosyl hydrolase [Bacteroidales bacterium]|nr:glycosyl hydrolase [Bacteroidales bacterium]
MKRRTFLINSMLFTGGGLLSKGLPSLAAALTSSEKKEARNLFHIFKDPGLQFYPFVRWWWNGNKIEADELIRELHLLKNAGIGGVEINPIEFPSRQEGDDLGIPSLQWLSREWIEMLQHTLNEAKNQGMTCDLIVGSGWPFGSETLSRDERAQVMLLNAIELEGPGAHEISRFTIFKGADPGVSVPYPGRTFDLISLKLVPDPVNKPDEAIDLDDKIMDEVISFKIPEGRHYLYALVRVNSFASVINGAPGAAGPILNHMDRKAVRKYLDHMSDTIQEQTGPLSKYLRAFFTDSMELEGCNWTDDFPGAFREKRGYDIVPWLPYIMFRVGRLGGVVDFNYGATKTDEFDEEVRRVRFDFELTKAELLHERFNRTYLEWCRDNKVMSRAQSYGRGFFPLESSLGYDIPEGESWTTNWLKHTVGEEMPDDDYRRGRAYTMINKYVSSAAHLEGKRMVSCEEMTNTYKVFNTSLELLKIGSDQSIMSGITHSIWHGFNYSPPEAPYPGWIQYGSYYNENNNWWPYLKYLNAYKARISALLQNADMYSNIAIMPANYDLWGELGVQTDPFPERLNVPYTSLIWEAINKNGGAADYITEIIINESDVKNGCLCYGPKKYGLLILPGVSAVNPGTLTRILEFVSDGGKVICIGKIPEKSPGYSNYRNNDIEVKDLMSRLMAYGDSFILIPEPDRKTYLEWMGRLVKEKLIPHYMEIEKTDPFLMQIRYRDDDGREIIFFSNSSIKKRQDTRVKFSEDITENRYAWIWDPESGERYRIEAEKDGRYNLRLGPAESRIILFDRDRKGKKWHELPAQGSESISVQGAWDLEFLHCRKEDKEPVILKSLQDLMDIPEHTNFSGTVIYRKRMVLNDPLPVYMNLGSVYNISEVYINGRPAGLRWYGNHIYEVGDLVRSGDNDLEIRVVTLMGNYMKSLTDNPSAQYWTNLDRKNQLLVSMGLIGPITLYR